MKNMFILFFVALFMIISIAIISTIPSDVKVGEKYLISYNMNDPFENPLGDTLYVIEVKNEWVRWKIKYKTPNGVYEYYDTGTKKSFLNSIAKKIK